MHENSQIKSVRNETNQMDQTQIKLHQTKIKETNKKIRILKCLECKAVCKLSIEYRSSRYFPGNRKDQQYFNEMGKEKLHVPIYILFALKYLNMYDGLLKSL